MVGAGEGDTEEQVTDGQVPGEKYMTGTSTALAYPPYSGTKSETVKLHAIGSYAMT